MHVCMHVFVYVLARVLNAVSGIFTEIDECESDPCQNGGTCNEGVNGYECDCPPFISGINCETGKRCPMLGVGVVLCSGVRVGGGGGESPHTLFLHQKKSEVAKS